MKYFDLTLPTIEEENPKIHKIFFENFRKSWTDCPRALAERMVELGYAKWAPCTINGAIHVPQSMIYPMQLFFVSLPTRTVKAVHVNSLVPDNGPVPMDLVLFCQNLIKDVLYEHAPEDMYDPDEYDASLEDDDEAEEEEVIQVPLGTEKVPPEAADESKDEKSEAGEVPPDPDQGPDQEPKKAKPEKK